MDIMLITVIMTLVGVGFALQYWICSWKRGLFLRLLPGMVILASAVFCWIPVIGIPHWENLIAFIGVFFLAFGLGGICMGCLVAWIVYAVGRIAQNQRK